MMYINSRCLYTLSTLPHCSCEEFSGDRIGDILQAGHWDDLEWSPKMRQAKNNPFLQFALFGRVLSCAFWTRYDSFCWWSFSSDSSDLLLLAVPNLSEVTMTGMSLNDGYVFEQMKDTCEDDTSQDVVSVCWGHSATSIDPSIHLYTSNTYSIDFHSLYIYIQYDTIGTYTWHTYIHMGIYIYTIDTLR